MLYSLGVHLLADEFCFILSKTSRMLFVTAYIKIIRKHTGLDSEVAFGGRKEKLTH